MMQKSICIFCLALSMICLIPRSYAQKGKSEISVGYGYFSFYSFLNAGRNYGDAARYSNSSGASVLTYRYYVTRDVTLGMGFGYENISDWGSFVTFAPEVTVSYLDTRQDMIRVKLYGAFSLGIAVLQDANIGYGHADESGAKFGFQATPIGIRVGRQIAGFAELGLGYKGLIHGGLALRVPRKLAHREHQIDESK